MTNQQTIINEIKELKETKNATILSHVYQNGKIQDIADYTGDSLALSKIATQISSDIIVFCGVQFMAETANILNPEKTILLPNKNAGCDLADMASVKDLEKEIEKHPDAKIVCYINSSAEIKALSDYCCTSANAIKIVESIKEKNIIFLPDKNLGSYIAEKTDKNIILWNGYCYVHELIKPETIIKLKKQHPNAEVIVHPECPPKIRKLADCIGGTAKMAAYVHESTNMEFIVGTEDNFIHKLKKENSSKKFYSVNTICRGMKQTSLNDVKESLIKNQNKIIVPENIRIKAKKSIDEMMKIS